LQESGYVPQSTGLYCVVVGVVVVGVVVVLVVVEHGHVTPVRRSTSATEKQYRFGWLPQSASVVHGPRHRSETVRTQTLQGAVVVVVVVDVVMVVLVGHAMPRGCDPHRRMNRVVAPPGAWSVMSCLTPTGT
jgi:hypothetical protein